jgi:hypothetical protein
MTKAIYDENILSDLHKDAYGFRPRELFFARWDAMSVEEKNDEWEHLLNALADANDAYLAATSKALKEFRENLRLRIKRTNASNWKVAMTQWMTEEGRNYEEYGVQEVEGWLYEYGLAFPKIDEIIRKWKG